MSKLFTLLSREVKAYFYSPIAYIVLCFLLLLTGFNFYLCVSILSKETTDLTVVDAFFNSIPFWMAFIAAFPVITMRLFAEEFKMGTIETLMTAPVYDWQVVLSKFAGAVIFFITAWLPSLLYFVIFEHITKTSAANAAGAYWGSYLLLLLVGMFFISIGLLASVLTHNQIVAAVITFSAVTLFFFCGLMGYIIPNVSPAFRDLVSYFCTLEHMGEFSKGIIDSRRIVFYGSSTFFLLMLTHTVFQYRRWKA